MSVGLLPTKEKSNDQASAGSVAEPGQQAQTESDTVVPESFMDMRDLWEATVSLWREGAYGIDISQLIIGLGILFGFLVIRGIFARHVLDKLHIWTSKSTTSIDDKVVDALIPPIKFIPVILGIYFSFRYVALDEALGNIFTQLTKTLVAYTIFWALYRSLWPISDGLDRLKHILTPTMVIWLFKSLRIATVLLGGAVILEIWGIEVGPLLAGLGLFGVAVALGAQDFFKNLIAGVTVIAEKRFQPGDWVKVEGVVEGTVEDVGIRSTQIRRFDKAPVHVPNSQLSDTAITNFSRMTNRRIYWQIGVVYKTTTEQLKTIRDELLSYIHDNDDFEKNNVVTFVRVDSFGASSIDIMVYCFTKTTNWGEWLDIKEQLAMKTKEIVEEIAGTSFAFPSQSIYVEELPNGDKPEIFVPPKNDESGQRKAG